MNSRLLRFYWQLFAGRRRSLLLTAGLLVLQPLLLAGTMYGIKRSFDNLLTENAFSSLLLISLGLIVLYVCSGGLALLVRYRMMRLTHEMIQELRHRLTMHLYQLSRSRYAQFDRKQLQTVLLQDVIRVDIMSNALVGKLLPNLVIAASIIAALIYLNWLLFLVIASLFPLLVLLESATRPTLQRHIRLFHRRLEALQERILFGLEALDLTHIRGVEQWEIVRQVDAGDQFRRDSAQLAMLREILNFTQDALMLAITVVCLLIGGWFVIQGHMSGGELFVFYGAIVIFRPYVQVSWSTIPQIVEGIESLKTLVAWLTQADTPPQFGHVQLNFTGEVLFQQVAFGYREADTSRRTVSQTTHLCSEDRQVPKTNKLLLQQLDLHIQPGKTVAIVGPNGAGKSTLTYLLLGFYQPQAGAIFVDGIPLTTVDIGAFRRQVGVVPQSPLIFHGTMRENITYGMPHASQAAIHWATGLAQLDGFIDTLPAGYETVIGDHGMLLSGGQRQRIALARALLPRPTFLILDEPTNHLDHNAIQQIMHNLRQPTYSPTCLLITHDMTMAAFWDEVYHLKDGRLHRERETQNNLHTLVAPDGVTSANLSLFI